MAAKEFPMSVVIRAIDRVTAPMRGIQSAVLRFDNRIRASAGRISDSLGLPAMTAATQRLGTAMGDLWSKATRVLGVITGIGAAFVGLGFLAAKSLIGTASQFEKFETVLTTIEGSQAKAAKSMEWVSDFAAKTPYELNEVMESFVKLRAYGIDPTNGTLRVLGDTAAAMGKPVMQAVEAIADAMTGENERLKEFGIRAKKEGDKITYEYTKDGKTMTKSAKLSNRAMVQATLMAIWNDRYAGAMDKLSGTWGGMTSNLSDQWERFKLMIMKSGPFERLRERLSGFLKRVDEMAESGELQRLAEKIGTWLVEKFDKLWAAGERLVKNWDDIKARAAPFVAVLGFLVEKFGAANVIIAAVASVLFVTFVPALYAATTAMYAFTVAVVTNPIGAIAAVILAVAAAILYFSLEVEDGTLKVTAFGKAFMKIAEFLTLPLLLYRRFMDLKESVVLIKDALVDMFAWMRRGFADAINWAGQLGAKIGTMVPDWAKNLFGGGSISLGAAAPAGAAPVGAAAVGTKNAAAQQGSVRVQVDMNGLPPGTRVKTEERGAPEFELNQGFAFGGS